MTELVPGGLPILIGMVNPYGTDPQYALYPLPENSAGGRLFSFLKAARPQVMRTEYRDGFERLNLCTGTWDRAYALGRAAAIRRDYVGRTILLLGTAVRDSFGCAKTTWGAEARYDAASGKHTYVHWAPHPSGRNPAYNELVNRQRVGRLMARMLDGERGLLS